MKIEKLKLNGFKSFADSTTIEIHPGITCIVGPNGSGKSNIVDALRWVLGEQSAKTLRGGKMEEVIFNGSQSKKPKGMAEVSLYIRIPDDSGNGDSGDRVITVGRRLYRSGESEYLINKRPCRLKDIREMFLDTGLEMKSYSIIEQGRIGEIINAKPQDRRFLIEEVAGIMKYKSRKAEAQNKLENSRLNLQRIEDILKEVKRQRNSLDRQAKKAERYKKLRDELREVEIRLSRQEFLTLTENLQKVTSELDSLNNKEAALRGQISQREALLESKRLEALDREKEIDTLQAQLNETENRLSELERKKAVDERDVLHLQSLVESLKREIENLKASAEQKSSDISGLELSLEEVRREIEEAGLTLERKSEVLKELQAQIGQKESDLDKKRRELFSLSDHIGQLRNNLHRLELTIEGNHRRVSSAEREFDETKRRSQELEAEIERETSEIEKIHSEIEEKRKRRKELSEELSRKRSEIEELKNRRLSLREEIVSAESRIKSLKEMLSGSTEAEALKDTGIKPVATVSELIEVNEQYERAVEAALEEKVRAMVFSERQMLLQAVKAIGSRDVPRATLMLSTSSVSPSNLETPAGTLQLSEVVRVAEPAEEVIRALLSNFLLIETVEQAMDLINQGGAPLRGVRFVTPRGEVVEPPGVVTCGSGKGILKKRREIRELETQIGDNSREIERVDSLIEQLDKEVEQIKESLKGLEAEIVRAERELSVKNSTVNRLKEDLNRYSKKAELVEIEIENLKREIKRSEEELQEKKAEIELQSQKRLEIESDMQILQDGILHLKNELDAKREELTEFRIGYNSLLEREKSLKDQIEQSRKAVEEAKLRKEQLARDIREKEERIVRLKKETELIEEELRKEVASASQLRQTIKSKRDVLEQIKTEQKSLQDELSQLRGELDQLSKELHQKGLTQTELSIRLRNLKEQMAEKHQVDLSSDSLPISEDVEQDRAKAEELRQKMASMGEVNLAALEEFSKLNERYEFLKGQHEDIVQSIEELEEAIARINRTTRKRLREAFEGLNLKFNEVFKTLFGGGHAELRLTDESNILESGIDIIAQPPGKRLQNITLLSGGEKALTALALLFAGFLLKPTPLCILDEADAPLDENNVVTFREMVRELSKNIQFVVITHNRLTMEVADYLYGITMEEAGVSKVLSLQFEEVAA